MNPNYFAAIAVSFFVIILNIGSIIIAYHANDKWYFVTFIIPLLWIYTAIIHFYVSFGLFNWEKRSTNRDLKISLLWLFLFFYILIFFTAGYENVLLKPALDYSLLKVYSVFPGDFLLFLSAYFFLKLNRYGCFGKIKITRVVLIGIGSLAISWIQHFLIWTKDNIPGFIDPNKTHLGISGWVHFLMEFVGIFLWALIVIQIKIKNTHKLKINISLGFLFLYFYICCMYLDSFKPGVELVKLSDKSRFFKKRGCPKSDPFMSPYITF